MFPSDQQGQTTLLINLLLNLFKIYIPCCCYYHPACYSSLYCQGHSSLLSSPIIKLQKKNSQRSPKNPNKIEQLWKINLSATKKNLITPQSFTNFQHVAIKVRFDEKRTPSALSKEMKIKHQIFCYVFKTKETKDEPII